MQTAPVLSRLEADWAEPVARLYRAAYDDRFPFLAGRHRPEDDVAYFRDTVFPAEEVWGALLAGTLCGIISFRPGWVEKLYVLPRRQGQGLGRALLDTAKERNARLQLWTFACNTAGRAFYERQGFRLVRERDASEVPEGFADALYAWER